MNLLKSRKEGGGESKGQAWEEEEEETPAFGRGGGGWGRRVAGPFREVLSSCMRAEGSGLEGWSSCGRGPGMGGMRTALALGMGLPVAGIEGQGGVPPWSLLSETGSAKEADARVKMGTVMERVI